jgi:Tc toxin complex TcA C-terminal TcB-binding domain
MTMAGLNGAGAFNFGYKIDLGLIEGGHGPVAIHVDHFTYDFQNSFHPFVGPLIQQLNQASVAGMLDPDFLAKQVAPYTASDYTIVATESGPGISQVNINLEPRTIDLTMGGHYAVYNWELAFYAPVAVAVHLSSNQRFAEAQNWFHLVFDPTSTDTSIPAPQRFWKFLAFRNAGAVPNINTLLTLLSTPDSQLDAAQLAEKQSVLAGYQVMLSDPFQPYAIARTRQSAFQWYVVMKYLDNLIAWGDSLFLQDTIETINEATLCYVLAANILGPKPQALPPHGTVAPRNFLQLKQAGLDAMANALVELEGQFPFNLPPASSQSNGSGDLSGPLFGIGNSLYFCTPPNQILLGYWDTVATRLSRIRNSETIAGVAQQLPLFDPPLDPGMLVKAAAAGINVGSIVSGLNQPAGPVRSIVLIGKALELAAEVRALGNSLLSALEKSDAEQIALLRQGHEIVLQQQIQNVRYLQWQQAQEATTGLLRSRATVLERFTYYLRLLGLTPDSDAAPTTFNLDRRELTEDNFDDAYAALVGEYDLTLGLQGYSPLQLAQGSSPSSQSGATGTGALYLNKSEDDELNSRLPNARDSRLIANLLNYVAAGLTPIPSAEVHLAFWGVGAHSQLTSGPILALATKLGVDALEALAAWDTDQAAIDARTAGYQRRADEWTLQANLAARELMQIGRQILAALIAEQVAYHEYQTVVTQVQQAQAIQAFLQAKFTSAAFYGWMQSEISGLYYQYYRLACDTARQAEQTMKQELMRPELHDTTFVQFNYWDTGHQGLLSGEALYLDLKRMEMAYLDNNKREIELTRHVSLAQLDPVALVALKITGTTTVAIPEWLFDLDGPGLYMRRIKLLSLSIPGVVGPYTSLNCTLTLQRSSVRTLPTLVNNTYARDTSAADPRFVDYYSSTDIVVTSSGDNDSGMFEPNLNDQRLLPFEGAGAISTWTLSLPSPLRTFDYMTISDVILHIRHTARSGGSALAAQASKELVTMLDTAGQSGQAVMLCLRYDFPAEWATFVNGTANFAATLSRERFPYIVQGAPKLTIDKLTLYAANGAAIVQVTPSVDLTALSSGLSSAVGSAGLSLPADAAVMQRVQALQVFLVLKYHFGTS